MGRTTEKKKMCYNKRKNDKDDHKLSLITVQNSGAIERASGERDKSTIIHGDFNVFAQHLV